MKKILIASIFALAVVFATVKPEVTNAAPKIKFVLPNAAKVKVKTDLNNSTHTLKVTFSNIIFARNISYELTYSHDGISEGVLGQFSPRGLHPVTKSILLGTCSTGGTCVFHTNLSDMKINVTVHYSLFNKTETSTYTIL